MRCASCTSRNCYHPCKTTIGSHLALAQPPPQRVGVNQVQRVRDRKGADACEDLASVRLCAGHRAEATVQVVASAHEVRCSRHVHQAQPPEKGQARQTAVREARVHLAPLVAEKAAVRLLQVGHVPCGRQRRGSQGHYKATRHVRTRWRSGQGAIWRRGRDPIALVRNHDNHSP
jgi:hypothetical protein